MLLFLFYTTSFVCFVFLAIKASCLFFLIGRREDVFPRAGEEELRRTAAERGAAAAAAAAAAALDLR